MSTWSRGCCYQFDLPLGEFVANLLCFLLISFRRGRVANKGLRVPGGVHTPQADAKFSLRFSWKSDTHHFSLRQ